MMTKEDLALEQQQMRERWANRRVKEKPAKSSSPPPGGVALPPVKPAPAKPISRLAPVPAESRSQHQEALALGFSLGVPRLGSDIPPPRLSMRVCAAHSATTRANARAVGANGSLQHDSAGWLADSGIEGSATHQLT